MTATDELRKLLDERGVEWKSGNFIQPDAETQWGNNRYTDYPELPPFLTISNCTPEQAIAATLGTPISADLRTALDFMRIWITEDAHLGESAISYEFEKAEGLRKLDAIESAIAATLGRGTCENIAQRYLDFLCSECGFVHYIDDSNCTGDGNEWNYCPKCGWVVKQ